VTSALLRIMRAIVPGMTRIAAPASRLSMKFVKEGVIVRLPAELLNVHVLPKILPVFPPSR
jgi:hypothetical protein